MCGVRKLSEALPVHAVIHESAASLDVNKPRVSQNFQMMRDRGLANRKVLYDFAHTHRRFIVGKQVKNANANRVGKSFEPLRVLLGAGLSEFGGAHLRTATSPSVFLRAACREAFNLLLHGKRVSYSSTYVNILGGKCAPI